MDPNEPLTIRELLSGHVHTRQRGTNMSTVAEYPHLKFSNLEHYKEALLAAEKLGQKALESLKDNLARLEEYCARDKTTAELHPDVVAHSFYFRTYTVDGSFSYDGGIILHGIGESFSVELCPKDGTEWSMHT